jgi:hypothetical protein
MGEHHTAAEKEKYTSTAFLVVIVLMALYVVSQFLSSSDDEYGFPNVCMQLFIEKTNWPGLRTRNALPEEDYCPDGYLHDLGVNVTGNQIRIQGRISTHGIMEGTLLTFSFSTDNDFIDEIKKEPAEEIRKSEQFLSIDQDNSYFLINGKKLFLYDIFKEELQYQYFVQETMYIIPISKVAAGGGCDTRYRNCDFEFCIYVNYSFNDQKSGKSDYLYISTRTNLQGEGIRWVGVNKNFYRIEEFSPDTILKHRDFGVFEENSMKSVEATSTKNEKGSGMNIEDVPPLFVSEITILIRETPSTSEKIRMNIEDRMQPVLLFIFVVALWNNIVEGFSHLYDGLKNSIRHISRKVNRRRD